ncbi:hypothetical protein ABFA07_020573 [Porites harrisoni]
MASMNETLYLIKITFIVEPKMHAPTLPVKITERVNQASPRKDIDVCALMVGQVEHVTWILMNAMKRVTSVARMRLVQTRKDLTNAGANMVSMVTATTAQILTNVKSKTTCVAKMRLALTQTDPTDATAILASMETDSSAQYVTPSLISKTTIYQIGR